MSLVVFQFFLNKPDTIEENLVPTIQHGFRYWMGVVPASHMYFISNLDVISQNSHK